MLTKHEGQGIPPLSPPPSTFKDELGFLGPSSSQHLEVNYSFSVLQFPPDTP